MQLPAAESEKKRGVDKHCGSDCQGPKRLGPGSRLRGLEQRLRLQGFDVVHADVAWLYFFHARRRRNLLQGNEEIRRRVKLGTEVFMECRRQQRKAPTMWK